MLIIPIKKKWYDMILSGNKKEEYREIKPYYTSRIKNEIDFIKFLDYDSMIEVLEIGGIGIKVMFRNGYSKNSPSFIARCTLSVGTGKEEWGAEKSRQYFILTVQEILKGGGQK